MLRRAMYAHPQKEKAASVQQKHPLWDSNPQSSAPETDALSIWPLGHVPEVGFEPTRTYVHQNLSLAP